MNINVDVEIYNNGRVERTTVVISMGCISEMAEKIALEKFQGTSSKAKAISIDSLKIQ